MSVVAEEPKLHPVILREGNDRTNNDGQYGFEKPGSKFTDVLHKRHLDGGCAGEIVSRHGTHLSPPTTTRLLSKISPAKIAGSGIEPALCRFIG